jgi:hypothetical protein
MGKIENFCGRRGGHGDARHGGRVEVPTHGQCLTGPGDPVGGVVGAVGVGGEVGGPHGGGQRGGLPGGCVRGVWYTVSRCVPVGVHVGEVGVWWWGRSKKVQVTHSHHGLMTMGWRASVFLDKKVNF